MKLLATGFTFSAALASQAAAQVDFGTIDSGRVVKEQLPTVSPPEKAPIRITGGESIVNAPASAADIETEFKTVELIGMSAFPEGYFDDYFANYIGRPVPLTVLWNIANHINKTYAENGYLLSRVYVPDQTLENGIAKIKVIEGFVEDITIDGTSGQLSMITNLLRGIKLEKPLRAATLESALLRLGDLYGVAFDAVLEKGQSGTEGGTILNLVTEKTKKNFLFVSADNYGSRFSGPGRLNIYYERSFAKFQKTAVNALISLPDVDELNLLGITHKVQITPAIEISGSVSRTVSQPGHTLESQDVESASTSGNVAISWRAVRQRDKNLTFSIGYNALDSRTDISDLGLTRDSVRSVQVSTQFDRTTKNGSRHIVDASLTQGIDGLGSSEEGDLLASRAGAQPDFTKANLRYQHQRLLTENLTIKLDLRGQYTSDSLYSSEEFGYGGADIGRAYDYSEILGDSGVSANVEIGSQRAVFENDTFKAYPYAFADTGQVWNSVPGEGTQTSSASSAGVGMRASFEDGLILDAFVAVPIDQSIETPIFGDDDFTFRVSLKRQLTF